MIPSKLDLDRFGRIREDLIELADVKVKQCIKARYLQAPRIHQPMEVQLAQLGGRFGRPSRPLA